MPISATIPAAHVVAANAELEAAGFGPGNFSVPVRISGTAGEATHAGLHAWDDPALLAALQGLDYPGLTIRAEDHAEPNFAAHVAAQALDWSDPTFWFDNPVMTGHQRTHEGKTWESLTDFNVWEPPVAWREVVAVGYPAWVQPTGAHDAYALGDRVTHLGQTWETTISANVWAPGVYGWSVVP